MRVLLNARADFNAVDSRGCTALSRAALAGHLDCVELLLAADADARRVDIHGHSPLMLAVLNKRVDCAKLLLPLSATPKMASQSSTPVSLPPVTSAFSCCCLTSPTWTCEQERAWTSTESLSTPPLARLHYTWPV